MSAAVLTDEDLELEEQCWQCQGSRKAGNVVCELCNGLGSRPTEFGNAILNFVRRRLKAEAGA